MAAASGCRITEQDLDTWKGTVKGPGKLLAVMKSGRYELGLRAKAAYTLIFVERQEVDGLAEYQKGLRELPKQERAELLSVLLPQLSAALGADAKDSADAVPSADSAGKAADEQTPPPPTPKQVRAKDGLFVTLPMSTGAERDQVVKRLVTWYLADLNGRSLAGDYSAEQVFRGIGSSAADPLVDALDTSLPAEALERTSGLIAELGSEATRKRAAQRLLAIDKEVRSKAYGAAIEKRLREHYAEGLKAKKIKIDRIKAAVPIKRHSYLILAVYPSLKHFARNEAVAERLLDLAHLKGSSDEVLEERRSALSALEGKASARHARRLAKLALNSQTPPEIRDLAFDRLGEAGDTRVVSDLWPLLQSDEPRLRWRVGELLLTLGGASVLGDFFARMPSKPESEYTSKELEGYATRVSQMSPAPFSTMKKELQSSSWWRRVVALYFFQRRGQKNDVALLEPLSGDTASLPDSGWPEGESTVGQVAERSIQELKTRLAASEVKAQTAETT